MKPEPCPELTDYDRGYLQVLVDGHGIGHEVLPVLARLDVRYNSARRALFFCACIASVALGALFALGLLMAWKDLL